MKDFIVLIASIMLGLCIYGLIAGDEGSIKSTLKEVWIKEAESRNYYEMVDNQ